MSLALDTLVRIVRASRGGIDPAHVQDATLAAAELLLQFDLDADGKVHKETACVVTRIMQESTNPTVTVRAARLVLEHGLERAVEEAA